ncbi:hypothetical protein BGX29_003250 [Mortierella sp. GBA35]|nr:hypothetical protein BGX29_003250 [Mortierella sp. GBA35]
MSTPPPAGEYTSVERYHAFEDFFRDPPDAEGIVRRRWRKHNNGSDDEDEDEQWDKYRGHNRVYYKQPELDKTEDEDEETAALSTDPRKFNHDKKRNILLAILFLTRRIPEYLRENRGTAFEAKESSRVFKDLAKEISVEEPRLRGTSAKSLVGIYSRVVDHAESLSKILETDTETGWRESFRSTVLSDAAAKLANLGRQFRGIKRIMKLEYIGPDPEDVAVMEKEEIAQRMRTRNNQQVDGGSSGKQTTKSIVSAVVIPVVDRSQASTKGTRKRMANSTRASSAVVAPASKRPSRRDASRQRQPGATSSSSSRPQLKQQLSGGHASQPPRSRPSTSSFPRTFVEAGEDDVEYYNIDAYALDNEPTDTRGYDRMRSQALDKNRYHEQARRSPNGTQWTTDRHSRSTPAPVPPIGSYNHDDDHGIRGRREDVQDMIKSMADAMGSFQRDMEKQMCSLGNLLQIQKARLDSFQEAAETILTRLESRNTNPNTNMW